jgi:glycosyltransferase involved in cell wall biosynthesis
MSDKQLVSCIIIFFNAEKFLEEAIESVFAQTYKNWELLLVDDGSNEDSTTIALKYAEKYPKKVCYLEHEGHQNRGMSATRNLGIRHAKGEYIAFLDADDIWLPRKLERKVAILNSHPEVSMVCGSVQFWYSWTGNPDDMQKDFVGEICNVPYNTPLKSPEFLILLLQRKVIIQTPSCILARRDKVERIGGFEEAFRGDLQVTEDQVFNAKICLETPVIVVREFLERYRQHPDSCCSIAKSAGRYKVRLTYLKWLEGYLSDLGVKDAKLWKTLRRELLPYNHPRLHRLLSSYQSLIKQIERLVIFIGRRILPFPIRHWLWTKWQGNLSK